MKTEDFMKGWDVYAKGKDDSCEDEPGAIADPRRKPDQRNISPEEDARQMGLNKIYEPKKLTAKEFEECVDLCEGE